MIIIEGVWIVRIVGRSVNCDLPTVLKPAHV
jgi:hypothetical protein